MTIDVIRNEDYLRQITDFSGFAVRGQDIDFDCDWGGKVFLRADWKYRGGKLTGGQLNAAVNWVNAIGQLHHAFFAVAEHAVALPESIKASDLVVNSVFFRTPEMSRYMFVLYDENHRPSWNTFTASLAQRFGHQGQMTQWACFDDDWFLDPVFSAAHDSEYGRRHRKTTLQAFEDKCNRDDPRGWLLPFDPRSSEEHRADYLATYTGELTDLPDHFMV